MMLFLVTELFNLVLFAPFLQSNFSAVKIFTFWQLRSTEDSADDVAGDTNVAVTIYSGPPSLIPGGELEALAPQFIPWSVNVTWNISITSQWVYNGFANIGVILLFIGNIQSCPMLLSQIMIGWLFLSQDHCNLIDWYWNIHVVWKHIYIFNIAYSEIAP